VHAIYKIGPHGELLEPKSIIGTISNQCSYIVREHILITYLNWRKVLEDLKGAVWGDVQRWFEYPLDQCNEELYKGHALYIAGKALHNLQSKFNKQYVKKGKTLVGVS
jgi:hypothetical protein